MRQAFVRILTFAGAFALTVASVSAEGPSTTGGGVSGKISFAKEVRLRGRELANVIVSVEGVETSKEALQAVLDSRPMPVIDQKDMKFRPHVLPVLVGEEVGFPNSDPLFHNVYSSSKLKAFNLGMYPQGESKELAFDEPGVIELFCNVHSEMKAYLVVKEHPYFTGLERDGTFHLDGIPPGTYTLHAWHPKAQDATAQVTIESGANVEVDVEFTQKRKSHR